MKFEADIITFLQSGMTDFWLYFFRIVTLFGSWLGFVIALMVLFYKNKKLSYAFFGTFICGTLLNKVIKHFIARPRPFVTYQTILDLGGSTGYSMPSGHSCAVARMFRGYFENTFEKPLAHTYASKHECKTALKILKQFGEMKQNNFEIVSV